MPRHQQLTTAAARRVSRVVRSVVLARGLLLLPHQDLAGHWYRRAALGGMAGDEGSRALAELEARGLAVVRGSCGPEAATRAAAEVHGALERMLRLPTTMAERARAEGAGAASPPRHFVPFATEPGAAAEVEVSAQRGRPREGFDSGGSADASGHLGPLPRPSTGGTSGRR